MLTRTFGCQVCLTTYNTVFDFKKHVSSWEHRQNMKTVFPEEKPFKGNGHLPTIIFLDSMATFKHPIIGLSQLTICYSPAQRMCFYLCHVCEEKCSPGRITKHFYHGDHNSNYLSFTNPDSLNFAWIPSATVASSMRVCINSEVDKNGPGVLQILDLPLNLYMKTYKGTYSEVMHLFSENENLSKNIAAALPKRKTIQLYFSSDTRQHPLLGMQHIVECICAGQEWKRHYLCTLCRLTLTTSMIIKHVLSFDHIHSYFEAWHPSTLMSKLCYKDNSESFSSLMLDLAHQSQNILGTANSDIKQVTLEPDAFASVKLACYDKALKELESITKNETEHSLITSIKPGNKLERSHPTLHSSVISSVDTISAPKSTSTNTPNKVKQEESEEKQEGESVSTECESEQPFYVLRCQDCNMIFQEESHYLTHVVRMKHQKMLKKIFKVDATPDPTMVRQKSPSLYTFVKNTLKNGRPVVGASLIVTVLCTKASDDPVCVCFACEDCFFEKNLKQHMVSTVHLVKTLLYQNPWRLPFAWDNWKGLNLLKTMALEEEKERGRSERMVKVLDVPQALLRNLKPLCYPSVMNKLVLYHPVLKRSVPPRETQSKLDQNDRFPLLGVQFLVKYAVNTETYKHRGWHIVCLLCQRTLSQKEHTTHIFSREHVAQFLESFHPGSLTSHYENKEIMDLAKQAARIHPVSSEQEILLEQPIWEPCSYQTLKRILASAKKRNFDSPTPLEPLVTIKMKLVPREKIKEVPKNHVKEGVTEGMNQKCPGNSKAASENMSVESVAAKLDLKAEVALENCLLVKETSTKELTKLTVVNQSDISERENMPQYTETEFAPNQGKYHRKRPIIQCEESKDTCLIEAVGGVIDCKKQRLILNEETEDMSDYGKDVVATPEKGKQLQQFLSKLDCPAVGSHVLYECWCVGRDPIYLCEYCSLKVKEEDIVSHITDSAHPKMSPLAVDLDEDAFNRLLNQNFKTSLQTVRALQDQQEDGSDLPSTSGVQPVATSVTTACQHEVNVSTDNLQVMDMEVEDSVELFSSATAAITVMTTASAFSQGGPGCPVQLGVQMTVTQDITVNTMDPTPSSCFSATSSSTAENLSSLNTVRSTLVDSSCTPTNIKCNEAAFRSPAATSCATGDHITSIAVLTDPADTVTSAPSTPTGEIFSSSANKSNTTKSSPNQLDIKAEAGPKVPSTMYKSAFISVAESADVCEDPFKTTTSYRELSETASTSTVVSQTEVVSSVPKSKSPSQNTEAMHDVVYMKNFASTNIIAPNVGKSNPPAALTTPVFVRSQHKTPPTEPSLTQDRRTKSYVGPCPIGIDQLIKVICEERRQTYCQLCMVRLMNSSHTSSFQHQHEYVKLMYPGWTPEQSKLEEELRHKVNELAQVQKDVKSTPFKWIKVNLDVYQELAALPVTTALQRLLEMVNQKNSRNSPSTADPGKNTRQPVVSASPSEFTSPNFDMHSPPNEIAGFSTHNQTEKGNKFELKTALAQKTELRVESPSTSLVPQTTGGVSVRPPIQTPDTGRKTYVHKKQQSSYPVLQDAQDSTAGSKETLSSKSVSSDALVKPSTLSQKAEHGPRLSRCSPGQPEAFKARDTIRMGEMDPGPSNLSKSLRVIVTEPFIGLGAIWECRGISNKPLKTIYLCECCEVKLLNSDIGQHMVSTDHQITYMLSQPKYLQFLYFCPDKDLTEDQKVELVKDVVSFLRERETSMDAQSVLLHFEAYDYVCKKPFREALNMVRNIQRNDKVDMPIRPAVTLPSENASAYTESQMSPVYTGSTHQGAGQNRTASLSQMDIQQQPQQVTTLSFVQNNTVPGASAWLMPAVQPQ